MRAILTAAVTALALLAGSGTLHAQPNKVITIAIAQEPDRLYRPATVAGRLAANLVFDPLVGLDDAMRPYPVLAETMPSLDNGLIQLVGTGTDRRLVVTMPLRQGVTWSDGAPFTADDVVYTWSLMMNPRSGFNTTVEDKIKTVERIDDVTVRFTYMTPTEARASDPARFADQGNEPLTDPLAFFGLYDAPAIYPRHKLRDVIGDDARHSRAVEGLDRSDFASAPVGTGPYVLANWEPGASVTFTSRNLTLPQRQARPAIDSVVFQVIADHNDSIAALSQGQIDFIAHDSLDAGDAPSIDNVAGIQASYIPGNAWEHLTFNLENPILAEPLVRQAIARGLDRDALNGGVLMGKGQVETSQVPPWSWAVDPAGPTVGYNAAQAQALLDKAGWLKSGNDGIRTRNGRRLSLKYWTTPAPFRPLLTALIKGQLAAIGIDIAVETIPGAALFDPTGAAPQSLVNRSFDVVEFAWLSGYDPASDALYSMHSRNIPTKLNLYRGGNYGGYRNPRNDVLLDQLRQSLEPPFRRIALAEVQAIWQSDLPVVPILLRPVTTASSPRLMNVRPTPAAAGETWNIEQWDLAATS